jgi:hypothetical protein
MPLMGRASRRATDALVGAVLMCLIATPTWAQGAVDPNPGNLTLTTGIDVVNAYFFRGIPQDDTGVIMWPYGDLGIALHSGDGVLKTVGVNVGLWNSLHTGNAGTDGVGKLWYESDFYATLGVGLGAGTNLGVTYTAYTSPNGLFGTVKEVSFKFAVDDSGRLGRFSSRPYVLLAQELVGQADGGSEEGTYLEFGAAPTVFSLSRATVSVPLRVGLSVRDYYETATGDERFGFFSIAGMVTVPMSGGSTKFGSWNVHGGVEYLRLGDRNAEVYGDSSKVIGSIGVGLSY